MAKSLGNQSFVWLMRARGKPGNGRAPKLWLDENLICRRKMKVNLMHYADVY
jgi:hypothetical protein